MGQCDQEEKSSSIELHHIVNSLHRVSKRLRPRLPGYLTTLRHFGHRKDGKLTIWLISVMGTFGGGLGDDEPADEVDD